MNFHFDSFQYMYVSFDRKYMDLVFFSAFRSFVFFAIRNAIFLLQIPILMFEHEYRISCVSFVKIVLFFFLIFCYSFSRPVNPKSALQWMGSNQTFNGHFYRIQKLELRQTARITKLSGPFMCVQWEQPTTNRPLRHWMEQNWMNMNMLSSTALTV